MNLENWLKETKRICDNTSVHKCYHEIGGDGHSYIVSNGMIVARFNYGRGDAILAVESFHRLPAFKFGTHLWCTRYSYNEKKNDATEKGVLN